MATTLKGILVFLMLILISGCRVEVENYVPRTGDLFCVYNVTKAPANANIRVGDKVCILCPPPATQSCPSTLEINDAGAKYDLVNVSNTCTECPSGAFTFKRK
jgi:hypothetical protein